MVVVDVDDNDYYSHNWTQGITINKITLDSVYIGSREMIYGFKQSMHQGDALIIIIMVMVITMAN